jgi:hypothetical protein
MKAIVTGHSKGLGAALARELLTNGVPVLGLARSSSPELLAAFPSLMTEVEIDLADTAALAAWLQSPALGLSLRDCSTAVLINNAGMVEPVGALSQQDPVQVAKAVALNIAAPLMLASAFVAATKGIERRVLHISSGAGSSAYPGWSVYCATKAALDHHARAVALDAEEGVRICSLAPGVIDTGMQAAIRATPEERFPLRQRFVDLKGAGQLVSPADCATRVIAYVLSNSFGHVPVDDLRNT